MLKAWMLRDPERDGRSSWTAKDLCRGFEDGFGVSYSENGIFHPTNHKGVPQAAR